MQYNTLLDADILFLETDINKMAVFIFNIMWLTKLDALLKNDNYLQWNPPVVIEKYLTKKQSNHHISLRSYSCRYSKAVAQLLVQLTLDSVTQLYLSADTVVAAPDIP